MTYEVHPEVRASLIRTGWLPPPNHKLTAFEQKITDLRRVLLLCGFIEVESAVFHKQTGRTSNRLILRVRLRRLDVVLDYIGHNTNKIWIRKARTTYAAISVNQTAVIIGNNMFTKEFK